MARKEKSKGVETTEEPSVPEAEVVARVPAEPESVVLASEDEFPKHLQETLLGAYELLEREELEEIIREERKDLAKAKSDPKNSYSNPDMVQTKLNMAMFVYNERFGSLPEEESGN